MNLRDYYQKGYCTGNHMTNKEILEAVEKYKQAADAIVGLGPCFNVTFKELNNVYMHFQRVAVARGIAN